MSKPALLLIDDEKTVIDSLIHQIRNVFGNDFRIEAAMDADEAWEILEELTQEGVDIRLVISDWLLPRTKGDRFLVSLYERYPHIHQIMLSGYADEESVENARKFANLKAYVRKPWDETELMDILRSLLT